MGWGGWMGSGLGGMGGSAPMVGKAMGMNRVRGTKQVGESESDSDSLLGTSRWRNCGEATESEVDGDEKPMDLFSRSESRLRWIFQSVVASRMEWFGCLSQKPLLLEYFFNSMVWSASRLGLEYIYMDLSCPPESFQVSTRHAHHGTTSPFERLDCPVILYTAMLFIACQMRNRTSPAPITAEHRFLKSVFPRSCIFGSGPIGKERQMASVFI
jgi:hypothetical protein